MLSLLALLRSLAPRLDWSCTGGNVRLLPGVDAWWTRAISFALEAHMKLMALPLGASIP